MTQRRVIPNSSSNSQLEMQTQRYQTYQEPNSFYRNLEYSFASDVILLNRAKSPYLVNKDRKFYSNQTQIPNNLKRSTWSRSMVIQRLWTKCDINFIDILPKPINQNIGTILLHIPHPDMNLVLNIDRFTEMLPLKLRNSYILFPAEIMRLKMQLLISRVPSIICLELLNRDQGHPFPTPDIEFPFPIDKSEWETFSSFTLSPIFNTAQQLVILSTKFAHEYNGTPNLSEITIMDHLCIPMLKTLVCPRKQVINYAKGHSNQILTNQRDQWDIYPKIVRILTGKVIVGVKVSKQISAMRINPMIIRGIRDLSTSIVFKNRMGIKPPWNLFNIAAAYHEPFERDTSTLNEATIIFKLYKKVELTWVDNISPWKDDMAKVPWDIVNKNAMHYYPFTSRAKRVEPILPLSNLNKEIAIESNIVQNKSPQDQNPKIIPSTIEISDDSGDEIWLDPMDNGDDI